MLDIKLFRLIKGELIEIKLDEIKVYFTSNNTIQIINHKKQNSSDSDSDSSDEESQSKTGKSTRTLRGSNQMHSDYLVPNQNNAMISIP